MRTIAFLLIGGQHQFLHGVPVAAALSRRTGIAVVAYVRCPEDAVVLRDMLARLGAGDVRIVEMRLPAWIERFVGSGGLALPLKTLRLAWWSRRLRAVDAIVALERTSSVLRRLPGRHPLMIQILHGAGDRAKGYDPRISLFDHVLVAGEKDRDRLIALGLMAPEHISVVGYVKRAGLQRMCGLERPRLFSNSRAVVLYNPHFEECLSSWPKLGRAIIRKIVDDGRFNLIVAPHVRLFEAASASRRAEWEALSVPDRVIIDLGSARSIDMTYTLAADVYIGDVSSQVYEFCAIPRPCIFIDAHRADWRCCTHYTMWHLGQVIDDAERLIPALERALAHPDEYAALQDEGVRHSFGDPSIASDELAADRIAALVA